MGSVNAVEVEDLRRTFAKRRPRPLPWNRKRLNGINGNDQPKTIVAVDGVSFAIRQGEIFGLLGPNGAGKTTTIRMLCTLLEPTSGAARVASYDIRREPAKVRASLGTVLAGDRSLYWKLTGRENLEYFAALYNVPPSVAHSRIAELLDRLELAGKANELVEKYSTGMKQRLSIARALLANPPVLLLDEPTSGLDPQSSRNLRSIVRDLKHEGHTIVLTTHYMAEADELSDRIAIIDHGKVIALDTPTALKGSVQQLHSLEVEIDRAPNGILDELRALPLVRSVESFQSENGQETWTIRVITDDSRQTLDALLDLLRLGGDKVLNLKASEPTLEDVFITLTGKSLRE
ncbi:MAG: ATP-binding cassette domain-containing protein [Clostridia bacterium]|nr:ATP-binding cassette domain-containing protein [Clostridia bacterium]